MFLHLGLQMLLKTDLQDHEQPCKLKMHFTEKIRNIDENYTPTQNLSMFCSSSKLSTLDSVYKRFSFARKAIQGVNLEYIKITGLKITFY